MPRLLSTLVIALALVVAAGSGDALAQKKPNDKARAQEHYQRALKYEELRDWDKAIAEYRAAYELFPDAEFYYLIGEAALKKGDKQLALSSYDAYLSAQPNGRVAAQAKSKADTLRAELAAAAEAARLKAQEEAARAKAEEAARAKKAEESAADNTKTTDTTEPDDDITRPAPARPGRGMRIAGIATAGAGVVAIGLGVKFGLDARSAQKDVEQQWDPARFDEGEAANRNMVIFYSVGAAAVIGGATLYYLGRRKGARAPERLTVAPALTDRAASLVVAGRF